jgi:5-formyltetrahydrofolate cyclo-ligase
MKNTLRTEIKNKLKKESADSINIASTEICKKLNNILEEYQFSNILAWIPCFKGEVDLSLFIEEAMHSYPVYLPKIVSSNNDSSMQFVKIDSNWTEKLKAGVVKVKEPEGDTFFLPNKESSNFIILPALAFDKFGNRLGRGKGHYDKFLQSVRDYNFVKVGVCLDWQILDSVPVEEHDMPIDIICTEKQIIKISN